MRRRHNRTGDDDAVVEVRDGRTVAWLGDEFTALASSIGINPGDVSELVEFVTEAVRDCGNHDGRVNHESKFECFLHRYLIDTQKPSRPKLQPVSHVIIEVSHERIMLMAGEGGFLEAILADFNQWRIEKTHRGGK